MLISRVPEEGAGRGEPAGDIARNCQTANELFDLMTKDHDFEAGDDPLSSSDLVLLYKNIDLGNQLMSNVRSNQYVETVYHDDPETDSDLSESCSSEELRNIMLANKERIDLLTNHQASFNSLSHKLGDLEIQVSNISADLYDDRHFLYKDPYIKEQLQNLQLMTKANEFDTNQLPTSLLDFICCKRLEGNYNFYMDNVITYVTHTIDQLKRISNGDYLPDKVKEKWRESDKRIEDSSKALNTSISMPLQRKTRLTTTWDDIVRTEVDLRSLVQLMERKVIIEVPRMICGSYKFFSKFRADKLVITCERNKKAVGKRAKPRVDLVLRVQSAAPGQLACKVDSVMLPQLEHHQITQKDCKEVLPLEYQNSEEPASSPKIIELSDMDEKSGDKSSVKSDEFSSLCSVLDDRHDNGATIDDSLCAANRPGSPEEVAQIFTTAARVICTEAAFNHATPNDLYVSVTNLDRQTFVPEESTLGPFHAKAKKKSPERSRVKSPYENKSHILEERKRRRLLEVRERRERKKKASNENSKVSKHKVFPQAVSSVTKLSITNKAFYNSIYGRNMNGETDNRMALNKARNGKGTQNIDGAIQEDNLESEGDVEEGGEKSIKNIRTNFLDDTETEMSYLQSKQGSDFLRVSTSTSVVSNESATNLCAQTDYCSPLTSCNIKRQESTTLGKRRLDHEEDCIKAQDVMPKNPANSPNGDCDKEPAIECRRSLEKIYTLMQKLHEIETNETTKKKAAASESRRIASESGTSLKRRVSFSNTNTFEKHPDEARKERDDDIHAAVVPKVVISAKLPAKIEERQRKTRTPRVKTIPENPLKAISQLLHEFENVQKSRPKIADPKSINRSMSTENTEQPAKIPKRRSRIGSPMTEDLQPKVTAKVKTRFGRDERGEAKPVLDKKITDLLDEVKEARGEAVRGPARFSARLHALAQPKRAYVQALAGDFPRRQTPDRPSRPASNTTRPRRLVPDAQVSPVRGPNSSLERAAKHRQSAPSRPGSPQPQPHPLPQPQPQPQPGHRVPPHSAPLAGSAAHTLHSLKEATTAARPQRHSPARAPLLPRDFELASLSSTPITDDDAPQSKSIGIKLHRMVRAMLHERPVSSTDYDSSLEPSSATEGDLLQTHNASSTEGDPLQTHNASSTEGDPLQTHNASSTEGDPLQTHNASSTEGDPLQTHNASSTEGDPLQTHNASSTEGDPLQTSNASSTEEVLVEETPIEELCTEKNRNESSHAQSTDARNSCSPLNSVTELEHALAHAHALHRSLSSGACAGRLRVNKLTLSPRPSLQQVMLHQSGDTTLVLKSSLHQKIQIISQSSDRTDLIDILSTTRLNSGFSGFPLQISTVGFAFPTHQRQLEKITPKIVPTDRFGACETRTSYEVSEQPPAIAVLQVKGDNKEEACQCVIGVPGSAQTETVTKVCSSKKDAETASTQESNVFISPNITWNRDDDEGTSFADQEDNLPSDYTASFDILVGLLNEIQKITTCGCDAVSTEIQSEPRDFRPTEGPVQVQVSDDMGNDGQKNCVSLYMSRSNESSGDSHGIFAPETKSVSAEAMECKPLCEDKEVLARVQRQQVTASTSRQAGLSNDTATSTCSINVPSTTCSVSAHAENCEIGCNTIQPDENITEQAVLETNRASVKSLVPYYNNIFKVEAKKEESFENYISFATRRNASASCNILLNVPVKKNSVSKKCDEVEIQNRKKEMKEFCLNAADFDSTLRVKRNILVTFYSILVLTVFAALAFPEMLQLA